MGRNLCWKKYCQRIQNHQKRVDNSIKNITNWEMSTSLITTSKISTHQASLSVFILGIVIILYLVGIKVLNSNKKKSSKEMLMCSHLKCTKSKVLLCLIFYVRLTKNSNEPLYKISRHQLYSPFRLFLKKTTSQDTPAKKLWMFAFLIMLLIIAGDVEINPGPYDQELLRELMKHLRPLASECDCVNFGIQLHINFDEIKAMKSDRTPLLATLLHHWLCNTQEDKQFSILCKALETIGRNDLVHIIQQNYTAHPFKVKSTTATSHSSNPTLQHLPQYSENTTQISQISYNESFTATSSKSLEQTETLSSGKIPFSIKLSERFNDEDIIHEDSKYTLHFQALDSDDAKNKAELEKETMKINNHYNTICDDFYTFLKYNPHAVGELKYILQTSMYSGPIEKDYVNHKITKDQIEDIEDLQKLWRIFHRFISFFNFRLLERAFKVTDYADGIQEITKYHKEFQNYLKGRVTQCPSGIGMKGNDHVVVLVKLDDAYTNCTMKYLAMLGEDICKIIRAEDEKLHIEGVLAGSICVLLHLHKSAIPNGFVLTESQIGALKQLRYMEAKILTIECGTVKYIIHNIENCNSSATWTRKSFDSAMAYSADDKPRIVIAAGELNKGKTTVLNNIFDVDFPNSPTLAIHVREQQINGKQYIIVDTPGFGISGNSHVKKQVADAIRGLDFTILFCMPITSTNDLESATKSTMADLQNCLHNRIWEKCVLLLTYSDDMARKFREEYPENWDTKFKDYVRDQAIAFKQILRHISLDAPPVKTVYDYMSDHVLSNEGFSGIVAVPVCSRRDSALQDEGEEWERRKEERKQREKRGEEEEIIVSHNIIPGIPNTMSWYDVTLSEIENKTALPSGELEKQNFYLIPTVGGAVAGAASGLAIGTALGLTIGAVGGPIGLAIGGIIGGPVGAVVGGVGGGTIGATIAYRKWIKSNKSEKIRSLRNKIPVKEHYPST